MLPSWLQDRYGAHGPSPGDYVPRWDPLRRDRLPDGFPELEHVPDSTEPVFQHWPVETLVQRLVTWAVFSFLAVELGRLVAAAAVFPLLLPLWFGAGVVLAVLALKNSRSVQLALPQMVAVPVIFAAALLIDTGARTGDAQLAVGAVALFLSGLFLDTLARHALDLRVAGGAFSDDDRTRILGVWRTRFDVREGLSSYVLGFLPLLVAVVLSLLDAPVFVLLLVPALTALLIIGAFNGYDTVVSSLRAFLLSLELWTDYGLRGEGAPGVVRTAAGERGYRLLLVPVVLFALACVLLPREAHVVDLARGLRLLDSDTLWRLVLTLTGGALIPLLTLTAAGAASVGAFLVTTDRAQPVEPLSPAALAERTWNRLVSRLQSSSDERHRRQLLVGFHATEHYPVLLPVKTLQEHVHILGGSGGGKTSRAFLPLVAQLTRYGANGDAHPARADNLRGPVVVVDLKGEPYLFHAVHEEARKAGRRFRYFSNVPGRSTYAFNPLLDLKELGLPPAYMGSTVHAALNLEHGTGYGRGYYSAVTRGLLQDLFTRNPKVDSLRELSEAFQTRRFGVRPSERKREEEAYELISSLDLLSRRDELNLTARTAQKTEVFEERIRMSRVIEDDEVLYLYFGSHGDEAGARFVASLALECLYTAAIKRQETSSAAEPKPVYILIDEFQMVAGRNFAMFLQLARSAGLALILSNQSRESLRELDLLHALDENTAYRQFFTARTPEALSYLEEIGGITAEHSAWDYDEATGGFAVPPHPASRLTRNTLITLSAEPDLSLAVQTVNRDYAQYDGFPIVLRAPFHISDETRKSLQSRPWPTDAATLVIDGGSEERTAGSQREARPDDELEKLFARIHVTADGYTVGSTEA